MLRFEVSSFNQMVYRTPRGPNQWALTSIESLHMGCCPYNETAALIVGYHRSLFFVTLRSFNLSHFKCFSQNLPNISSFSFCVKCHGLDFYLARFMCST